MHEYARCSLALGPPAGRPAGPSSPPPPCGNRASSMCGLAGRSHIHERPAAVMIACVADVAPSQGVGLVTTHHSIHSSHLTQPDSSARSLVFLPFLRSFAHGVFQIDLMHGMGMAPRPHGPSSIRKTRNPELRPPPPSLTLPSPTPVHHPSTPVSSHGR